MTNAEMLEKIFGFKFNSQVCYMPYDVDCPMYDTCDDCPYSKWLNEEYTGEFKICGGEE